MNAPKIMTPLLVVLAMSFACNDAYSQKKRFPFRKSSPKRTTENLELSTNDGPWLIMCASFVGDDGLAQAKRLAVELREKNLNAKIFSHRFQFADSIEGKGWEVYQENGRKNIRRQRMKPAAGSAIEEIAVLVGDFPSVEDARAQSLLKQIKHFYPESLANYDPDRGSSQSLRGWREATVKMNASESKSKGPLRNAFLMPNPMLPDEYFDAYQVDPFVLKMNRDVRFSLLKNPSLYSVRVATFRGESTFEVDEINRKEREMNLLKRMGKPIQGSRLAEAFEKANKLTEELRRQGVDAYEFHERNESYVCVGGFDWISKDNSSGQKVFNPDVVAVIQKFKGTVKDLPQMQGALSPKVLAKFRNTDIVFDVQPIPVMVPKAQTNTAMRKSNWQ